MEVYDGCFPLGGGCAVAFQLNHRGKRMFATPLDWTFIPDERGLDYLPEGIATDFADMAKRENLVEFEPPVKERGQISWRYEDIRTGFRFIHHFHAPVEADGEYDKFRVEFTRRLVREIGFIESSKRVLFVLQTQMPFAYEKAEVIFKSLEKRYPSVAVSLKVIQFGCSCTGRVILYDGKLEIVSHTRRVDGVYDMQLTSAEWSFLDYIRLSRRPLPEERRRQFRFYYLVKLWVSLGKWLERNGAGCLGVRFKAHYN